MFQNYLKIALRNLLRNKLYTSINILGLSIGMLVCLLIFLFVSHELSFDRFHSNSENIYRLNEVQTFGNITPQKVALSMPLMGETMKSDFPEVEDFTRFHNFGQSLYKAADKEMFIESVIGVDSSFLNMFDFPWIEGDRENALKEPFCVVLTESVAHNFFGDDNPIGQTITDEDGDGLKVTGLIKDTPENSHLQFDALVSLTSITADTTNQWMRRWGSNFLVTYLQLSPNADVASMEKRFPDYLVKYMDEKALEIYQLYLQPFRDVHLASTEVTHDYQNYKKFDRKYVNLFIVLGLFVLAIACINFMNLSTARSLHRAKEVGVRKTIGASKGQLIWQFLGESVILSVIALVIAVLFGEMLVKLVNNLADRQLELHIFTKPILLFGLLSISIIVGLLSGILPAAILSAINPLQAIRQKASKLAGANFNFRSGLVLLQFAIAIGLIVSTFIVIQQYQYMKNLDTGFDREQVLLIPMNREVNEKYETLRERFSADPGILDITASRQRLGNNLHQTGCTYETPEGGVKNNSSSWVNVDHNYLSFYDIEILKGRGFSKEMGTDLNNAYVINEALAENLGWDDPIGKKFTIGSNEEQGFGTIIGVAKNFNYNSLHHKVEPLFLCWRDWGFSEISVRLDAQNIESAISHLQQEWAGVMGNRPLEFEFLDDHFAHLYRSEQQVSQVVSLLAFLAIFVACLGLFGLATIATEQRIKEIGIRKVLGATTVGLVNLLSKDFLKLVLISLVIACPLAYYFMEQWLMDFAFRIHIQWWVFAVAGVVAAGVAYLTVGFQSVKAALMNPVESLRSE
ncbi:MAG: ABC transporter permease [Saprospiraceae bacterium]